MSRLLTRIGIGVTSAALVVPLGLLAGTAPASAAPFRAGDVVGLVNGTQLVKFKANRPGKSQRVGPVRGLTGGDTQLIGIDRRVQNNQLYGVGDRGGVYVIGSRGVARQVNRLGVALEGSEFGVDFNPAADRLRIVSNTGQNLRHDLTGTQTPTTATDAALNYPATPTAPAINPADGITAAAYTNNDTNANTGTSLFVIDTARDQLAIQSPANAGVLQNTGKLGRNVLANASFDIGKRNRAFAVVRSGSGPRLVSVNLLNGRVKNVGGFGRQVSDIALPTR